MQNIIIKKTIQEKSCDSDRAADIVVKYPYISRAFLLIFCGYVIIWYLQIGYRIPVLGTIRFEFIYAAVLTLFAFFFTPKIETDCPLIPYVILYLIAIILQIPFSYDFDTSWNVFIDRIIKFAFMSFFIISFVRSPTHMKYFLAAFLLACLKLGQEGFVGRITGGLMWENQGIMRLNGSVPMYSHPNSFSGMALGTLPFVYYFWRNATKYERLILLAIGIFSLNIIIYTGSRTGYVGLCAFIIHLFIRSKNKRNFMIAATLFSVIFISLIPNDYIGRFDSIFTEKEKEGHSSEARIQIMKDAWQIFEEHPFGVGVSAFPKVRMQEFGRSQDTHNLYLQIATNLGVQGLIIVSLFIYKMLLTLNNIRLSAQQRILNLSDMGIRHNNEIIADLKFIESAALATSSFIVIRLVLGLFGMDLYEIYWWFALGITVALYSIMSNFKLAVK